MSIKEKLIKKLEEQWKIEKKSEELYQGYVSKFKDEKIKERIVKIINDEKKHQKVVEAMLKRVKSYKEEVKERLETEDKIKEYIQNGNAIILISKIGEYMKRIISALKAVQDERKIIYVSYNKLPKYTKKLFEQYNIDLHKIQFINCVESLNNDNDIYIHPGELTKLAITLTKLIKELKNPIVIVDTISGFTTYNTRDTIIQFVASLNDLARNKEYIILWIAIEEESESSLNSKLSQLCDETIR